jgi:hypothetical protein
MKKEKLCGSMMLNVFEERIHLTDDMIEEYSERYRNVLKLKKIKKEYSLLKASC